MEFRTIKKGPYAGMRYGVQGKGPVLILVHGFAEDYRIWDPIINLGIDGFTCLVPQLPGTGDSPLVSETMSIANMADAVFQMMVQETKQPCILLGHSMGGYIAAALADEYPAWIAGLGFIHSSVYADDETKKENRLKGIDIIRKGGKMHFMQQLVPALYSSASQAALHGTIQTHLGIATSIPDETLCTYYAAMRERPDRSNLLRTLEVPVLFVFGTEDQAVPLSLGLQQSTLPSLSMIEVLPGVAHTSMHEAPQILHKILNKYCQFVLAMKKS